MKVDLDSKGMLVVWAESDVERFALTHWHSLWENRKASLMVQVAELADDGSGQFGGTLKEVKPSK